MSRVFKKLVLVSATSSLVIRAGTDFTLECVPCIYYSVQFWRDKIHNVLALIDLGSEVNAISSAYAQKLGLQIRTTNVGAQKIDGSTLETFGMAIASFQVEDKLGRARFFQETFLVAYTSMEVILGMLFLTLSNVDIRFAKKELVWRTYSAEEALPTTRRGEIIDKKEFAATALNKEDETFVVYMAALSMGSNVHPSRQAQIALLDVKKVTISPKYTDYTNVFSPDSATELPEHTGINNHPINLIDDKQPPYGPIYSLGSIELETLKTYIETNLANGFIRPSKSPADTPILFIRKKDGSFWLFVNYRDLNNLTIKNRYPLSLIGESFNRLGRAKCFTQLDLTNEYHRMQI